MSFKTQRILGLFRKSRNLGDPDEKSGEEGNFPNLREKHPRDVQLLERLMSEVTIKTARVLDYKSPDPERKPNEIKTGKRAKRVNEFVAKKPKDALSADLKRFISGAKWRTTSMEFMYLYRMTAIACFEEGDHLSGLKLLSESHAMLLHQHILHRYSKMEIRNKFAVSTIEPGLRPDHMKYDPESIMCGDTLREKLAEMPKEWYMVQITVQYNAPDYHRANGTVVESMCPLHITILPTGPSAIDPFCVTLPNSNNGNYDGIKELMKILATNKADLEAHYSSNEFYWKMRDRQNNKLKSAVMELEYSWLREWRILLMADHLENTSLVNEMTQMIDKLIADELSVVQISDSARWLLHKIAKSSHFLSKIEIIRAVSYVLRDNPKLANNVILSIQGKLKNANSLRTGIRKTLVIIVDESVDHVPFECMDILKTHPVTRFPSFHIAYAMFKEHEDTIVNGCKIVKRREKFGTFVVNPDKNLNKTERRLKLFLNYWLSDWDGCYGVKPSETTYEDLLLNHELLMYAGHGSGIQYLRGEKIVKLRIRSSILLFGCSSVKLFPVGGMFPPFGVSNQYLIACSPSILGMLWEVTDGDIDRMTAAFISNWIPSEAKRPWSDVDLRKWTDGIFEFTTATEKKIVDCTNELEMLRAVAKSKEICTQLMTAAAIIVRGLPLRLES